MSYTIPDQARFAGNVPAGSLVVQLDTGDYVAVRAETTVEKNTGSPVIKAEAWLVHGTDGCELPDCTGYVPRTAHSHTSCAGEIEELGSIEQVRKRVILLVLGAPAADLAPIFDDEIHATVREHASIRGNIAASAASGVAGDLATLL